MELTIERQFSIASFNSQLENFSDSELDQLITMLTRTTLLQSGYISEFKGDTSPSYTMMYAGWTKKQLLDVLYRQYLANQDEIKELIKTKLLGEGVVVTF